MQVLHDEVEQLRGAHPHCLIEASWPEVVRGRWDGPRLQQVLRNLVLNAIRHGAPRQPIIVALQDEGSEVTIAVTNSGPSIAPSDLPELFEPLKRGTGSHHGGRSEGGLGFGLFIVREITKAHGGQVAARSGETQTTFSVQLPRR